MGSRQQYFCIQYSTNNGNSWRWDFGPMKESHVLSHSTQLGDRKKDLLFFLYILLFKSTMSIISNNNLFDIYFQRLARFKKNGIQVQKAACELNWFQLIWRFLSHYKYISSLLVLNFYSIYRLFIILLLFHSQPYNFTVKVSKY